MYSEIKYTADVLKKSSNDINDFLSSLIEQYSNENVIIENTLVPNSLPDAEITCIRTGTHEIHTGKFEKVFIPAGSDGYIVDFQYFELDLYVAIRFPQLRKEVDPLSAAEPEPDPILFVLPHFVFKINYLEESILNNLTRIIDHNNYRLQKNYDRLDVCEQFLSQYFMPGNEIDSETELIKNIFLTMYYSLLINTPFFYGIIDEPDEHHNIFLDVIKKLYIIASKLDETLDNNSIIVGEMQPIFRQHGSFFKKLFFIHFGYLQHYNYRLGKYQADVVHYMDVDHENKEVEYLEAQNDVELPRVFIPSDHLYTNIYRYWYLIYNDTISGTFFISQPKEGITFPTKSLRRRPFLEGEGHDGEGKGRRVKKTLNGRGLRMRGKSSDTRKKNRGNLQQQKRMGLFNGGAIKKLRKIRKTKLKRNKTKNRKKKSKSKRKTKK